MHLHLPYCTLFSRSSADREMNRNGQSMAWEKHMESFTNGLAPVDPVRFTGSSSGSWFNVAVSDVLAFKISSSV